ncbi:MAG: hypothetical protein PWQ57_2834 [Desulfovibrionales bacterium]|nr:hypothetical protein [Desulfovibrionales bacterium]
MRQLTPIKAIRAKCLECSGGSSNEVKLCPLVECPLYAFRLGRNPNIKRKPLTPQQRARASQRLAAARDQAANV